MRIMNWGEILKLKGDVVYLPMVKGVDALADERPLVKYECDWATIYEDFPITTPELGCDYWSSIEELKKLRTAVVSDLDTSRDVYELHSLDEDFVVYDKEDLDSWIKKLQGLNINY